ncbi:hypothetical protein ASPVEDRAFT_134369 [Aspergillus versicolor CBS 583.65]|uniref:Uncharacterized protein n=1 Tax=Aspergillus versicolor CBS 583.65 TaxID=1036611 RepID=A0A1L9PP67_ASPVE|nr:uncharacterized protein ASPVEDRAFT_134369 [Aspergillus versicolor CBS 583.65]OJJ03337.1 hypothetical protein ASPVEDRAFT_134369 [Aspergillus versicolor CBS 583.65]
MPSSNKTPSQSADLQFERKNHDMVKLPKYARIHKRPIPHAPVASPYAGPSTPKIIYISSTTPYMSAVKRVQKLLRHAEKRATASVSAAVAEKSKQQKRTHGNQNQQERLLAALARGEEREQLSSEEVFVKATGKAMKVALRVGRWFESGGREAEYKVRIKTGSVLVVDDVEEDEEGRDGFLKEVERTKDGPGAVQGGSENKDSDDTTMLTTTTLSGAGDTTMMTEKSKESATATEAAPSKPLSRSQLRKRKRAAGLAASIAETELPETRTRWVNSVEVAISLK